ncbi:hypothetical protein FQN60_013423 [Etheostoma spectabile]|uniref:DDE Tnp4 domain-containing protein n=1 Tax=Etheostoma spectabile TaxID=54343 RepID=A0A5J5CDT5_9PERO|nr:hypothetical protein FQN60_013423 [Etheostoma spectabile]
MLQSWLKLPPSSITAGDTTVCWCNRWKPHPNHCPEEYPRDNFNRKGWHSISLQGVVDGRGLFWDVCVGYAGSVHDAQRECVRVLRQSHLWEQLSDGELLGQNKKIISGINVGHYLIEMAFGRLKAGGDVSSKEMTASWSSARK